MSPYQRAEDELLASLDPNDRRPDAEVHPWVARAQHNHNPCSLYRLPNEILQMFLGHLHDDLTSLACLHQVSRRLRDVVQSYDDLQLRSTHCRLPDNWDSKELRARLRRDELCPRCLERCEYDSKAWPVWRGCKFLSITNELFYCAGCLCCHPSRAFSKEERAKPWHTRVCIGREGVVRLCEHKSISWAEIENHIKEANRSGANANNITTMVTRCEHQDHGNSRDMVSWICSGPIMRVSFYFTSQIYFTSQNIYPNISVSSSLSVLAALKLDPQDRLRSKDIRSMFLRARLAGASYLVPHSPLRCPDVVEMRCFGQAACSCLTHKEPGQQTRNSEQVDTATDRARVHCLHPTLPREGRTYLVQGPKARHAGSPKYSKFPQEEVSVKPRQSADSKGWIETIYSRRHWLGRFPRAGENGLFATPVRPPHEWFHALDPESYVLDDQWDSQGPVWPNCVEPSCRNYYRSSQMMRCPSGSQVQLFYDRSTADGYD